MKYSFLIQFVCFAVFACGGAQTNVQETVPVVEPEPEPPFDPLAYLPGDTIATVRVHVPRITASPYFSIVSQWFVELGPQELDASEQMLLDMLQRGDVFWVAMVPHRSRSDQADLGAILISGDYTTESLINAVKQLAGNDATLQHSEIQGLPAFGNAEGTLVELSPEWWMVGPTVRVSNMVQQPSRPAVLSESAWSKVENRLDMPDPAIRFTGSGTSSTHAMLSSSMPLPAELVSQLLAASIGIEMANGVQITSTMEARDAQGAQQVAAWLQSQADQYLNGMAIRLMGLGNLHQSLSIAVDGQDVQVRINISDDDVRTLLSRLRLLLGVAEANATAPPA